MIICLFIYLGDKGGGKGNVILVQTGEWLSGGSG